ncbi:CPBP family intramembrane glutamic endopeptidase [Enterococcus columbae]|uniref:CAAX prenyl protease 2/Lysostaphin resistance protein A-like domain-containing protein n=1 Tax=Enterococcus columbae DSM 7374 = ATCC 51263 TaxID=1121865 RepID=S0K3M0_9ENTE|nr:CPBP family intramembrane glutamic endopeptidase [Enterococcus columbae]EOT39137.1 hypothetical protein OMW_02014 [Enterococcus columbae DSM 7374 = ATCC 51263]EOW79930.1 hypothetical protein I568_02281 [Enterococcus columbae DSM 7374 = ATCC 51263]OJG24553.1 hypothetical protein RR47_GL000276 [Enterococcus columbae DSM 7374 = ATCC 51263]
MKVGRLSFGEYLFLTISVAIVPVCFILVGDALVSMMVHQADMLLQMYAERISFILVSLGIYIALSKSELIGVNERYIFSIGQLLSYTFQIILVFIILKLVSNGNKDNIYLIFFLILNYLIAWEEEFVYRYMIPKLLKEIFCSNKIIYILQAIIFVYIGHMGDSLIDNLIYRIPLSFFLYYLKDKTGNIIYSTSLHSVWNIIINYI